jgi:hypothetical protein
MSSSTPTSTRKPSHGDFESRGIRPIQPIASPPRSTAVKRLSELLTEQYGHASQAAIAIAEAVEDPTAARNQLQQPSRIPVRGGTLYTVDVRVNALRVCADPINPRTVGSTDYPAAVPDHARAKYWAPRDLSVGAKNRSELHFAAGSEIELAEALVEAKSVLREQNDLHESIALNGIFFPLTVMPWIVDFDGSASIAGLFARDGSSRLIGAQENLGIGPADPLFGAVADPRRSRGIVKEFSDLVGRGQKDISTADAARAHSLMVPARVIVSYEPDPGSDTSLLDVVDGLVSLLHLDPPKPWTRPAEGQKRADIVIDHLSREQVLDRKEAEYFAGMLDQEIARKQNLPQGPDARAATILHLFASEPTSRVGSAVARGVRQAIDKRRAEKSHKTEIIGSLALRGHKWTSANERKSAKSTLPRAYLLGGFWDCEWQVTKRSPDEILNKALQDLEEEKGLCSNTLELAALGSFWLVVHGALGRESFGQSGLKRNEGQDNRSPATVLAELTKSERGLRVLHRAILDGRADEAPRRIGADGELENDGAGGAGQMHNVWLREEFGSRESATTRPSVRAPVVRRPPIELLADEVRKVRQGAGNLAALVKGLENIVGVGNLPVVEELGVPKTEVETISQELQVDVLVPLQQYGAISALRRTITPESEIETALPTDEEEEDEEEEDEEEDEKSA